MCLLLLDVLVYFLSFVFHLIHSSFDAQVLPLLPPTHRYMIFVASSPTFQTNSSPPSIATTKMPFSPALSRVCIDYERVSSFSCSIVSPITSSSSIRFPLSFHSSFSGPFCDVHSLSQTVWISGRLFQHGWAVPTKRLPNLNKFITTLPVYQKRRHLVVWWLGCCFLISL